MKTAETPMMSLVSENMQNTVSVEPSVSYASELSYHEMADVHVSRVSQIEQLRANVAQLEDLSNRMKFMTKEIRYLMKL